MVLFDKGDKILKSVDFQKSPEEWIRQLRTAPDVPDRADAAFALGLVRDNDAAANALGEAAQRDKFWGVREEALRSLGRINSPAARKQVLAALSNGSPGCASWPSNRWAGSMRMTKKSPNACKNLQGRQSVFRARRGLQSLALGQGPQRGVYPRKSAYDFFAAGRAAQRRTSRHGHAGR
jgi:hypothetical protein